MQDVLSFEVLTLKELGAIASEARVPRWSRLKKAELIDRLLRAGVVPPTVDELVARRRQEQEERAAEAAPLLPPTSDAPTNETPTCPISATEPAVETNAAPCAASSSDAETPTSAAPIVPQAEAENVASPTPSVEETQAAAPTPPNAPAPRQEKARSPKMFGSPTDENDRLVLSVCDPFWLRAYWEATPRLVERVRSAMGQNWHTSDPMLRLYRVDREPHGATRREFVADFPVRAGVNNCYVPVDDPPRSFLVELGYLTRDKRFFTLISSAVVETPQRYVHDAFGRPEENGLGFPTNFDAFVPRRRPARPRLASIEEETFRPDAFDETARRDAALCPSNDLRVAVDCEIVVKGKVSPGARVRVKEEPIRLKEDGTFSIRYRLPERRHVFPVVATSPDGSETRTVVVAVDRNTKTLDPVFRDEEPEE